MVQAGFLDVQGRVFPRMQILTVAEILDGKQFDTPWAVGRHEPQPSLPGVADAFAGEIRTFSEQP